MPKDLAIEKLSIKISKPDMLYYTDEVYLDMADPAINGIATHNLDAAAHGLPAKFTAVASEIARLDAALASKVDDVDISNKAEVSGDTFTGTVTFSGPSPGIKVNGEANTNRAIVGSSNGVNRWDIRLGNSDNEITGNSGSNFAIGRYANDGSLIDVPLSINRETGMVSMNNLEVGGIAIVGGGGGGTGLPSRTSTIKLTTTLVNNGVESSSVILAPSYRLLKIETDKPARIRLYASSAAMTADATRPSSVDPAGNHGVMLDFTTGPTALSWLLSPTVDGFLAGSGSIVPIAITNLAGFSTTIQLTLTWVRTEA